MTVEELLEVLKLDDCLATVLLLEYANANNLKKVSKEIEKRSTDLLKPEERMYRDRQWLLVYQTWAESELRGNGQTFLAELKEQGFKFFAMPCKVN